MEQEKLTRREILKYGGAAALTTAAVLYSGHRLGKLTRKRIFEDPHFGIEYDNDVGLTFDQASDLSIRFDKMYDKFGDDPRIETNQEELTKLAFNILPQFEKEGAIEELRVPNQLAFAIFLDGNMHNLVDGKSDCEEYAILNARFVNDWSRSHDRPSWTATVVHELAHVQQGELCEWDEEAEDEVNLAKRVNVENTAEIVTWEILAARVSDGNPKFILPLVSELRSAAISTAWAISLREGKEKEFEKLRNKLSDSEIKDAAYARAKREWKGKKDDLLYLLETYAEQPLNRVINAVKNNGSVIRDLALPVQSFKVDDLGAFLLRAEELVDEHTK